MFGQVVLLDELNRTPPRTQSALLEAMAEQQVSVDGETWPLPLPHLVIGTQNPVGQLGSFPLVESQLDRFGLSTTIGYPDAATETQLVLHSGGRCRLDGLSPVCDATRWAAAIEATASVPVVPAVAEYAVALVRATRTVGTVRLGASPGPPSPAPGRAGPRRPRWPRLRLAHRCPSRGRPRPRPSAGRRQQRRPGGRCGEPRARGDPGPTHVSAGWAGDGHRLRPRTHAIAWAAPVAGSIVALGAWAVVAHSSGSGWVQALGAAVAGLLITGMLAPAFPVLRATVECVACPADAVAGQSVDVVIVTNGAHRLRPRCPGGSERGAPVLRSVAVPSP